MATSKLYMLPIAVFILFPATFLITYSTAVLLGHTAPEFPYISDTGTQSPESCIFGQAMNLGAFLIFFTSYVRYRQVLEFFRNHSSSSPVIRLNKASFICGCIVALGISLVANFQETNVLSVHLVGAFMTFAGGVVFCWLQAICSYKTYPLINTRKMAHFRTTLAVLATFVFILGSITAIISRIQYHGNNRRKWYPKDGGWVSHVISSASEWICAAMFNLLILSLVGEFKTLSMDAPQVYIMIENLAASQYLYNSEVDASEPSDVRAVITSHSYVS